MCLAAPSGSWFEIGTPNTPAPSTEVFGSEGARIVRTPFRSPKANAHAERWVRTVRRECLDHLLILSRRHLDAVLAEFVEHYNRARPHRALGLDAPERRGARASPVPAVRIRRRDRLGGLIREYEVAA